MAISTLFQALAVLPAITLAAPHKRSPLEVQLVHLNDTTVTAVVTNTGRQGLNLLHKDSILDPFPSRKLSVSGPDANDAPFHGIHTHCSGAPSADDFTAIGAGESLHRTIDVADLYDLNMGTYDVAAHGSLRFASDESMRLNDDRLSFSSNILELPIAAEQAETLELARLTKRTTFESDCSGEQLQAVTAATEDCASMASAAAEAATNGDAAFFENYFGDSSFATRSKVAEVFNAVAKECSATPGGSTTSSCTDAMNRCSGGVLAYTYWQGYGTDTDGQVFYCPSYYQLPEQGSYCHGQTQGGTILHEMTHAVAGTDDLGYGYAAASQLSTEQALMNADSYTVFAEDLRTSCNGAPASTGSGGSDTGDGSGTSDDSGTTPEEPTSSGTPSSSNDNPSSANEVPSSPSVIVITYPSDAPSTGSNPWSGWWGSSSPSESTSSTTDSNSESDVSQGTTVDSPSSAQAFKDWWTALMSSSNSASESAGTVEASRAGGSTIPATKVTTVGKLSGSDGERLFGDGVDHRGHDHIQGSDEHGHWTD